MDLSGFTFTHADVAVFVVHLISNVFKILCKLSSKTSQYERTHDGDSKLKKNYLSLSTEMPRATDKGIKLHKLTHRIGTNK